MTQVEVINKLQKLKKELKNDGFIIDGIFGSYARNSFTKDSDIDIVYHLENLFYQQNSGFVGFLKLEEIKELLSKTLNKRIDLSSKNSFSNTAKKYILKEIVYV